MLIPPMSVPTLLGHYIDLDWVCGGCKVNLGGKDWEFEVDLIVMLIKNLILILTMNRFESYQ